MRILYGLALFIYVLGYIPILFVRRKWHSGFLQRFGFISNDILQNLGRTRNIWVHAVSVGEVMAVSGLIRQLRLRFPEHQIVLTTSTQSGYQLARQKYSTHVVLLWSPIDFDFCVQWFIRAIRPVVYAALETELWPNLFYQLHRNKIPVLVVNGRISDVSFGKYLKVRWFMKQFLKYVNVFCMQSALDVERIVAIGACSHCVKNLGNVKFDDLPEPLSKTKEDLGFSVDDVLWVAGSTHPGEEGIVLDIYRRYKAEFSRLRLVIVPRHTERIRELEELLRSYGIEFVLYSKMPANINPHTIILVDTIGHLRELYSVASFVFVGKSLTVQGGHNIIEPAFFAKPIVVGPYMQNFRDVMQAFVNAKAVLEVKDAQGLALEVRRLLDHPDFASELGQRARNVITQQQGAVMRIVQEIDKWMI